jgi:methylmalonyl-CoA/ethylmalonyl-CoA epimerase
MTHLKGHPADATLPSGEGLPPSPAHLHHVGIVMPSERRAADLMRLLGLRESYRGFVEAYEAMCIFTQSNCGSPFEFVVPAGGTLARFNRGAGGLHHVALVVDSITDVQRGFAGRGINLLEAEPIRGAGNFLCNFLPPAYTRGVIVEFIEELD